MILRHVLLHLIVFMNAFICMKAEKFVNSNVLQATNSMKTNQNSLNSKEKINSQSSSIASSKKSKLLTSNSLNIRRKEKSKETEQLYEAYNLLHSLAQEFRKPFDAPAVIVIGHQTSGKSALIEALMGFQFNQVGGGTKTRRPIALRMQYNPACTEPRCFLTLENGKEEARSLEDIQAYIESENLRLERDQFHCFDAREINIRMEYKFCPNMILIDTPGMLHPPKGSALTKQQRALAQAAREAESLVLSKIRCKEYIILCVEDTTDWKHATTRNLVSQVDPDLQRTVLVTTKLDTKIPQFSEAEDLLDFLQAPLINTLFPHILGGPFFTSVPSGRVGSSREFQTNEDFVHAIRRAESEDHQKIVKAIGNQSPEAMQQIGVSKLRTFLESQVEENYRRNVGKIVPLLQNEFRQAEAKLQSTEKEINALSLDRLKQRANNFRERFSKDIATLIHGSIKASTETWGETLEEEQLRGGGFMESSRQALSKAELMNLDANVGNIHNRLYGGAQYHRAMREFVYAVHQMSSIAVTDDEIANAAGVGDTHDGINFMRAAAVVATQKAELSFEPMLEALRHRVAHIMKRLFDIVESTYRHGVDGIPVDEYSRPFQVMVHNIFDKFVEQQLDSCLSKCQDDLKGMVRFVTWDSSSPGQAQSLYKFLPTPKRVVEIYKMAIDNQDRTQVAMDNAIKKQTSPQKRGNNPSDKIFNEWQNANGSGNKNPKNSQDKSLESSNAHPTHQLVSKMNWQDSVQVADNYDLLQVFEELIAARSDQRTSSVITALIQLVVSQWRDHFAKSVIMKFNSFFLMPFIDDFPIFLRNELDKVYENGMNEMFDIQEARMILQQRRSELLAECEANRKLQERFDVINNQLNGGRSSTLSDNLDSDDIDLDVDDESMSETSGIAMKAKKRNVDSKKSKKTNRQFFDSNIVDLSGQ